MQNVRFMILATREALSNNPDNCRAGQGSGHTRENRAKSHAKKRQQRREEKASHNAISQLTKRCPGKYTTCGWNIEKNGGCDHMTCMLSLIILALLRSVKAYFICM